MAGIYLHIPFCRKACHYCDFHFSTVLRQLTPMVDALSREIELTTDWHGSKISTVYFGGGTPSLLNEEQFALLMGQVHQHFKVREGAEVTLEANPDDLGREELKMLRNAGINRLSIGIQTFDEEQLRKINRSHTAVQAVDAFNAARMAGFENISTDLIYGLPGSSMRLLNDDLDKMLDLGPDHVSIYGLTIEPGTVFGNWHAKGKLELPGEDQEAEQFEIIMERLEKAGYEQYEISNFALPGMASRHNSAYWSLEPYLGIGPSAHSFDGSRRWMNRAHNLHYMRAIGEGELPRQYDERSNEDEVNEYIMTSLRTKGGTDINLLKSRWDVDLVSEQKEAIEDFKDRGFLIMDGGRIQLTKAGRLLADLIASGLFI